MLGKKIVSQVFGMDGGGQSRRTALMAAAMAAAIVAVLIVIGMVFSGSQTVEFDAERWVEQLSSEQEYGVFTPECLNALKAETGYREVCNLSPAFAELLDEYGDILWQTGP
jgi:hypothetical protein